MMQNQTEVEVHDWIKKFDPNDPNISSREEGLRVHIWETLWKGHPAPNVPSSLLSAVNIAHNQGVVRYFYDGLYLAPSTIPNAGLGLFTYVFIPSGTIIGYFHGSEMPVEVFNQKCRNHTPKCKMIQKYLVQFEAEDPSTSNEADIAWYLDPTNGKGVTDKDTCAVAFANEPPPGKRANASIEQLVDQEDEVNVVLVSCEDIVVNSEIFVLYNTSFTRDYFVGSPCATS